MTITCSLAQPNSWPSRAKHGLAVVLDSSRGGLASTLLESKVRTIFGRRTKIMPNQLPRVAHDEPMMVGDHPALEILNTVARVDGELVDSLPSDRDVLLWLSRVGGPAENDLAHLRADALLKSARALRATIRVLIEKRKAGKRSDPRAPRSYWVGPYRRPMGRDCAPSNRSARTSCCATQAPPPNGSAHPGSLWYP